jgi:hypothetical protein
MTLVERSIVSEGYMDEARTFGAPDDYRVGNAASPDTVVNVIRSTNGILK